MPNSYATSHYLRHGESVVTCAVIKASTLLYIFCNRGHSLQANPTTVGAALFHVTATARHIITAFSIFALDSRKSTAESLFGAYPRRMALYATPTPTRIIDAPLASWTALRARLVAATWLIGVHLDSCRPGQQCRRW